MNIGIFGGCFNPPHKMHKYIGSELINRQILDKVIYVPTGNNYDRKDMITAMHRYNMLCIMCEDNNKLEVSNYEIKSKMIYTYQTLDYYRKIYREDEIYLIIGSDNLLDFKTWKNYEYILDNYKILTIKRNEDKIGGIREKYKKYAKNIKSVRIKSMKVSSTEIRKNLQKYDKIDEVLKNQVDIKVLEYIRMHRLYLKTSCK